ncbi:CoA transferase [Phenylobacterium sp. LjRoot225]|uniref:CaiB/BaiF CoA transferase family protein n=1 Tax=Phenylobacterium sp. LjRoot225 TaxID=3342285 RepID=UPI003ECCC86B
MGGVFSGVRVVELAQFVFVPAAGALLADQGAEVVHVEPPGSGDPYRTLNIADGRNTASANLSLEQNNRGKKSVAIDLKSPEGREVFLKLIETADVFLTSLRPKAIAALGLGVETLRARNPKLIYARGNGVGFKGKEIDKAGYDASAFWSRGGFGHIMRPPGQDRPINPRGALGDHASATAVAYGIAGALFKRAQTGEPSVVDISLLANAMWILSADIVVSQTRTPEQLMAVTDQARFPLRTSYRTRDGRWVMLMFLDPDRYWAPLCRIIGRTDLLEDPRFADADGRVENGVLLTAEIAAAFAERDWADWRPIFEVWDAPWELVQTIHEVAEDPQALANGYMFDVEVSDGTPVRLAAGPVGFDGKCGPIEPRRAPLLGEHTDDILTSLGLGAAEVARLKAGAVIQ